MSQPKLSVPHWPRRLSSPRRPGARRPGSDFANQLHTFGIYGPLDYNAWLAKIACERLHNGLDATADKVRPLRVVQPPRGSTDRTKLPIPRRRNQHLLPRPGAGPDRGRGTAR